MMNGFERIVSFFSYLSIYPDISFMIADEYTRCACQRVFIFDDSHAITSRVNGKLIFHSANAATETHCFLSIVSLNGKLAGCLLLLIRSPFVIFALLLSMYNTLNFALLRSCVYRFSLTEL